jgi:hypothetical protein
LVVWSRTKKPEEVKKVAEYFEVTLDYLCFGIESREQGTFDRHEDEINAGIFEVVLKRVRPKKEKE